MKLSEAQRKTLQTLARGEKPGYVPSLTRRWLVKRGLITAVKTKLPGKAHSTFVLTLTEAGKKLVG